MTKQRKFTFVIIAVIALIAIALGLVSFAPAAYAEEPAEITNTDFYYGRQLDTPEYTVAKVLYNALLKMDFKSGQGYVVDNPAVAQAAALYAKGDKTLSEQFDAAFGCFYYDQVDYFYLDPQLITLSVASVNGSYTVTIGGGRSGSYLVSGMSADNVTSMINTYQTQLTAMVEEVKGSLAEANLTESNVKQKSWAYWNAYYVNAAITKHVSYSFCNDTPEEAFIRTAYGALVNGKAVCEGYARLFKAVMDRLGFKNVLISGLGIGEDGVEPHAWNAVYDSKNDAWYGMDCTWNDTNSNSAGEYIMISGSIMGLDHDPNPVVSDAGFQLKYPELYQDNYLSEEGDFEVFWEYHTFSNARAAGGNAVKCLAISYKGMNYIDAAKAGYYIALNYIYPNGAGTLWQSIKSLVVSTPQVIDTDEKYTYYCFDNKTLQGVEIAVISKSDDFYNPVTKQYDRYTNDFVKANTIEKVPDRISNAGCDVTYVPPAYIKSITASGVDENGRAFLYTDWQTRKQDIADGTMHLTVKYYQKLDKDAPDAEPGVKLTISKQQLDPRTVDMDEAYENSSIENFSFNFATSTAEFDFTPSPLYQHNGLFYTFELTHLQTAKENLGEGQTAVKPNSFTAAYAYADTYICTKCLGGGRYLIENAYSTPVLVTEGDLSTAGWTYKDKDGTTRQVSESQRSNLALVVTKPTNKVEQASQNGAKAQVEQLGVDANSADVTASTYEVDLNICGRIVSIPNGSYLSIKLGFPSDIKYDELEDNNVVFKLYHFKRRADGSLDYDNPEEIECIITPYGIVATVQSFSPYTLVTIRNAPAALVQESSAKKGITVKYSDVGGKILSSTHKLTDVIEEGGSITYTMYVEDGFEIEYAMLNGKAVKVTNGAVTLNYDQLESCNIFSCGFVATSVKAAEQAEGIVDLSVQNEAYAQILESNSDVTDVEDIVLTIDQDIEGSAPSITEYNPIWWPPEEDGNNTTDIPGNGGNFDNTGANPNHSDGSSDNDGPDKASARSKTGLIVGLSVAGEIIIIAAVIVLVVVLVKKKKAKPKQ